MRYKTLKMPFSFYPIIFILTCFIYTIQINAQSTHPNVIKSFKSSVTSPKTLYLNENSADLDDLPVFADGIEIVSFCNDPGKAFKSQISPVQLMYTDGESVVYTCDEFISLKQRRKCVHGKWQGETPVCGEFVLILLTLAKLYYFLTYCQFFCKQVLLFEIMIWSLLATTTVTQVD